MPRTINKEAPSVAALEALGVASLATADRERSDSAESVSCKEQSANHGGRRTRIDLAGHTFGRLTVVSVHPERARNGRARWRCRCACGNERAVLAGNLRGGHTRSCGCLVAEIVADRSTTHGHAGAVRSRTYKSWESMRQRCRNQNAKDYQRYGGRGITMCDRWINSFDAFLDDMGERPDGASIDRIDNNGPRNCRWTDAKTQANNRRPPSRRHPQGRAALAPGGAP